MHLEKIQKILYKAIGLHSRTIGSSTIMNAVNQRIEVSKLEDIESYYNKLTNDDAELKELIEEVVIPETWFFRDIEPFKMLIKFVKEEWLKSEPTKQLRVLSIPCATGEEPYSAAMALLDAGLMPSQIYIDAIDVSERNIKRCKEAKYRNHSFRGVDSITQRRFFRLHDDNLYHPDNLIKAMVNFHQASILDPEYVNKQQPYDVVFCRNLMIYFDDKTQEDTVKMLDKLLKSSGVLFLGHAETGRFILNKNWSSSYKYPKSFAVRKFLDDEQLNRSKPNRNITLKNKIKTKNIKHDFGTAYIKPAQQEATTKNVEPTIKPTTEKPDIKYAQQLADEGKLTEAESICLDLLTINKQDSNAYYLLAVIQMAAGDNKKATTYFRNVVYLEPKNIDALISLATIAEKEGDAKQARGLRERAQRCQNQV